MLWSGVAWRGLAWYGPVGLYIPKKILAGLHPGQGNETYFTMRSNYMATATATAMAVNKPSNGGAPAIDTELPYMITAKLVGTTDMLLHSWNVESIDEKSKAKKGSTTKKTDNIESYVRRDDEGFIRVPSEYVRMSVINAAKFRQDPRSPRKSAMDLYKAAIVGMEPLCKLVSVAGEVPKIWDYEDRRRVTIQRSGITRIRPAFRAGWSLDVLLMVNLPEYIGAAELHDVLAVAGKIVGLGDFRPTYGRFRVTNFEVVALE
jgi:hypothetical protein